MTTAEYAFAPHGFYLVHAFGRLVSPADAVYGTHVTGNESANEPLDLHCLCCQSRVRTLTAPGPDQPDKPVMVVDHEMSCPWLLACTRTAGVSRPNYPTRSGLITSASTPGQ
jgi:hypothetical protein